MTALPEKLIEPFRTALAVLLAVVDGNAATVVTTGATAGGGGEQTGPVRYAHTGWVKLADPAGVRLQT
jgi:hypothetical protein